MTFIPSLENYSRLQPMRSLHLVYVIFFLLLGGLAGEYGLRNDVRRWLALLVPLGVGVCFLQVSAYPYSAHIEWPGAAPVKPGPSSSASESGASTSTK